ncbi:MAG TPA: glycosyltransferase [Gallionellaceae bacterium]
MKCVLLQTAVPDYRLPVLQILANELGDNFMVLAGEGYFDGTTRTRADALRTNFRPITNIFVLNKLSFQLGCWADVLAADAAILELNPRILSSWIMLLIRRILGKRTAVWGHAWSRKGPYVGSTALRDLMCRLAGSVVAYTEREKHYFIERMPHLTVFTAPNALYSRSRMVALIPAAPCHDILYVGRLVADKKPILLLQAFAQAATSLPSDARLRFAGAGPELGALQELARSAGLADKVEFLGHRGSYEEIRDLYSSALASASPGYVGLSLVQSLCFGVPVLIARDEPHSPEIEAASDGANCLFFNSDDPSDLAKAIVSVFQNEHSWLDKREEISEGCARQYTVERMATGLLRAFGMAKIVHDDGKRFL